MLLTNAERLAAADADDVVGSLSSLLAAAMVEWSLPVLAIPRVRFGQRLFVLISIGIMLTMKLVLYKHKSPLRHQNDTNVIYIRDVFLLGGENVDTVDGLPT